MSLFDHVGTRRYGLATGYPVKLQHTPLFRNAPLTMKELPINIGECNKIFSSTWISPQEIAYGTKCNQLRILNVGSLNQFSIPLLKRQRRQPKRLPSASSSNGCGIHSIAVNPSETRLATGGKNPNDVGVYTLPHLDPVALGEDAHKDWIFCSTWLDDEFLVTAGRDNNVCLWHVPDTLPSSSPISDCFEVPSYLSMEPVANRHCQTCDRIRAMSFNPQREQLAVISLNGYLHLWDVRVMRQLSSVRLVECQEAVTLTYSPEMNLYANGSHHYLSLFDPRTLKLVQCCELQEKETGIRSLVSTQNILTMGTGKGLVMFYDVPSHRFITCSCGVPCTLKAGSGRLADGSQVQHLLEIAPQEYKHAVYSLSYDKSCTRLFTGGGPLHAVIEGNYAALWI